MKRGKFFWSTQSGVFVHLDTGKEVVDPPIKFVGTILEWYLTFYEVILDAQKKLLDDRPILLLAAPDVATILECLPQFHPKVIDLNTPDHYLGQLSKLEVWKSNKIPSNLLIVSTLDGVDYAEIEILGIK